MGEHVGKHVAEHVGEGMGEGMVDHVGKRMGERVGEQVFCLKYYVLKEYPLQTLIKIKKNEDEFACRYLGVEDGEGCNQIFPILIIKPKNRNFENSNL